MVQAPDESWGSFIRRDYIPPMLSKVFGAGKTGPGLDLEEVVVDGRKVGIDGKISLALLQAWNLGPQAGDWPYSRLEVID